MLDCPCYAAVIVVFAFAVYWLTLAIRWWRVLPRHANALLYRVQSYSPAEYRGRTMAFST